MDAGGGLGQRLLTSVPAGDKDPTATVHPAQQPSEHHLEQVLQVLSSGLKVVAVIVRLRARLVVSLDPRVGFAWPTDGRLGCRYATAKDRARGERHLSA